MSKLIDWIKGVFAVDWNAQLGVLGEGIEVLLSTVKSVFDSIKQICSGFISFFKLVFTGQFKAAGKELLNILRAEANMIYSIFKTPVNEVIALFNAMGQVIVKAINNLIDGLNHIKVPDWVPGIGGKGINLSHANFTRVPFGDDINEFFYDDLDWNKELYTSGSNMDGGYFDNGLELLTDDSYGIMYRSVERKQRNPYHLISKQHDGFRLRDGRTLGVHSVDTEEASGYILSDATTYYASGNNADDGTFELADNFHFLTQWKIGLTTGVENIKITGVQTTDNENTYTYGTDGYILSIENSLIEDKNLLVNTVGAKLVGLTFMNFSGEHLSYPLAEFMDLAYVIDRAGKTNRTILTDITFNFLGFTQLKCSAENSVRNSSKYVSAETKAIQKSSEITEKKISKYDEAVQSLTALMTQGMGFFKTEEIKEDKSVIFYLHNKERLEDSNIIWKMVGDAFAVSTDGGKTWNAGLDSNGNAVVNVLSAVGINCDWIHSGTLTLGGYNNTNGHCAIENASGKVVGTLGVNGYYSNDPNDKYAIRINNGYVEIYGGKGTLVGIVEYVKSASDGSEGLSMYAYGGSGHSSVILKNNGTTEIWGNSISINTDKLITGGRQTKTGRAVFSDGSYLDYKNGKLVGGRTASGTIL